jgi:hypothetical protein
MHKLKLLQNPCEEGRRRRMTHEKLVKTESCFWVALQEHLTLPSFHFDVSFSIFYYYFIRYSIYYLFKKKKKDVNRDYFLRILNNNFLNFFMKMCKINILGIEIFHFLNKLFFKMKCLKNVRRLSLFRPKIYFLFNQTFVFINVLIIIIF